MRAMLTAWFFLFIAVGFCLSQITACVSIPHSNSPYNLLVKDECYGNATLGEAYLCREGKWTPIDTIDSSSKMAINTR